LKALEMIIDHHSEIDPGFWIWKNFDPGEPNLACPCCGEFFLDLISMNCIQGARDILGKAMKINSGHRCGIHNARVGGAPASQHKKIAFDISLKGHEREEVFHACRKAGFGSFGFYQTFLHTDIRPGRSWFGKGARGSWNLEALEQS